MQTCRRNRPQKVLNPIFGEVQMAAETSTTPTTTPTPDATTAPDAAPAGWFIMQTPTSARVTSVGPDTLTAEIHLRSHGLNAGIAAAGRALGRTDIQQKVRLALDAADPAVARYLKLAAEAKRVDLETRRACARLATARSRREEVLLEAAPKFATEVVALDAEIAGLQSRADASASASAAISSSVAEARADALRIFIAADAKVHAQAFRGLRQHRDELVAEISAVVGPILTALAGVDRAISQAMAPSSAPALEQMLDSLVAATPAVSSEPSPSPDAPAVAADALPEAAPVAEAETPEAAPDAPAQCEARRKDGQQCNGRALAGTTRCVLHNPGKRAAAAPAETAMVGKS
jgi:hypothetical protein